MTRTLVLSIEYATVSHQSPSIISKTEKSVLPMVNASSRLYRIEYACFSHLVIEIFMLESLKKSGYVSKCNPTGELSLESIKMIFSPVYWSSPPVQSNDCRLPITPDIKLPFYSN